MRKLFFTFYRHAKDSVPETHELSWTDLERVLTVHTLGEKDGPAFTPGKVVDSRAATNVEFLDALCYDIDESSADQVYEILETLKPYTYVAYTTHSYDGADPLKIRIILPLRDPILQSNWLTFWRRASALVDNANDKSTKDASRIYFLPRTPTGENVRIWNNASNRWLSEDDLPSILKVVPSEANWAESGLDHRALKADARKLERSVHPKKRMIGRLLVQVADGACYANMGARHDVMLTLTEHLAFTYPEVSAKRLATLFAPSQGAMTNRDSDEADSIEAIEHAIGSARQKQNHKRAEQQSRVKEAKEVRIETARRDGGTTEYSEEELDQLMRMNGFKSLTELNQHWILKTFAGNYYFLTLNGYSEPSSHKGGGAHVEAATFLAPAPVILKKISSSGAKADMVSKSIHDLMLEYGSSIRRIVNDVTLEKSRFDPKKETLYLASAPRRKTKPFYHADIHTWLEMLGGEHKEKFLDWIAAVPQLDQQCAAMYLCGEPGCGKTLLSTGLANIWEGGKATSLTAALSTFNAAMTECPFIVADEELGEGVSSARLRRLIGNQTFEINQKYRDTSSMIGAVRVLICANNPNLLQFNDNDSSQDTEATSKRIIFIRPPVGIARYLNTIPHERKAEWSDFALAEHCLYLAETRQIVRGTRFLVEGETSEITHLVTTANDKTRAVCEWIAGYLSDPEAYEKFREPYIVCKEGNLLIAGKAIYNRWDTYVKSTLPLNATQIGRALASLAVGEDVLRPTSKGRSRFKRINLEAFFTWVKDSSFGDTERMEATLNRSVEARVN